MLSDEEYCPNEDVRGRRCQLGPGHETACHFGPYMASKSQVEKLKDIARVPGVRKLVCQSMSNIAPIKALRRRGFVRLRYVASRAWDAALTPAGRRLLQDLPR